jgi:hypothetical protein
MFKLVMFLLLASCATSKKGAFCVDKKGENTLVEKMQTMLSTINGGPVELKEIDRSCHKVKYLAFDDVHVVIYRLPGMDRSQASTVNYTDPKLQNACWDKALTDLSQLDQNEDYKLLLKLHKEMHPFEWKDMDVGPNKWVKCGNNDLEQYYGSLETLVHEVNHEIKTFKQDDVCLYLMEKKDYVCFNFDKNLPKRSLGSLDLNIIPLNAGRKLLTTIQETYLTNIDQEIWSLLDEMNAYGVTTRTMGRILKEKGMGHLITDGKRNIAIVSMFQLIVKRYFERLKVKNPVAYGQAIEQNRESLKQLFQNSNDAYLEFVRELAKHQETEKIAEKTFRKLFTHSSPFFTDLGWSPK